MLGNQFDPQNPEQGKPAGPPREPAPKTCTQGHIAQQNFYPVISRLYPISAPPDEMGVANLMKLFRKYGSADRL